MLGIGEAEVVGYLADRLVTADNQVLCDICHLLLYVTQGRHPRLLAQKVAQIVCRHAQLVGTVLNRRRAFLSRGGGGEIIVEQLLEAGHDIAIGIFRVIN